MTHCATHASSSRTRCSIGVTNTVSWPIRGEYWGHVTRCPPITAHLVLELDCVCAAAGEREESLLVEAAGVPHPQPVVLGDDLLHVITCDDGYWEVSLGSNLGARRASSQSG